MGFGRTGFRYRCSNCGLEITVNAMLGEDETMHSCGIDESWNEHGWFQLISQVDLDYNDVAFGELGETIILVERKSGETVATRSVEVDGNIIKPNTSYRLENGAVVEATERSS